jgi:hypothetical protein
MKILIITEHDPELMKVALAGAQVHGFVAKSEAASALKGAVNAAMNDQPRV